MIDCTDFQIFNKDKWVSRTFKILKNQEKELGDKKSFAHDLKIPKNTDNYKFSPDFTLNIRVIFAYYQIYRLIHPIDEEQKEAPWSNPNR